MGMEPVPVRPWQEPAGPPGLVLPESVLSGLVLEPEPGPVRQAGFSVRVGVSPEALGNLRASAAWGAAVRLLDRGAGLPELLVAQGQAASRARRQGMEQPVGCEAAALEPAGLFVAWQGLGPAVPARMVSAACWASRPGVRPVQGLGLAVRVRWHQDALVETGPSRRALLQAARRQGRAPCAAAA